MLKKENLNKYWDSLPPAVRGLLATSTLRQSGVTFVGTLVNGVFGAVFYILTARALGPASFGLMSIVISVATLTATFSDFGVDTGLVRFVSSSLKKDRERANRFLKLSIKTKLISGTALTIIGIVLSDFIAASVFQKPELVPGLRIGFTAVLTYLLLGFVVNTLKSMQKFVLWSVVQIGANLLRLIIIGGLFVAGVLTINSSVWVYSLTLLAGAVFGFIFFVPKDFLKVGGESKVAKEFFHYNKWIASFTIVAAVSSKLDTFIAARLLSASDVGLYAAANQLVYIVPQIVGALGTVFAPKMAEMAGTNIVPYLKKTQLMVFVLAGLGIFGIPIVTFLVPIIFGAEYLASIPLFVVLLFAMLIFLLSVPINNAILYYFSYPKLFFWLALGHLCIIGSVGWVLISNYGALGAAFTVLIGAIYNFLVPVVWVLRRLKKENFV